MTTMKYGVSEAIFKCVENVIRERNDYTKVHLIMECIRGDIEFITYNITKKRLIIYDKSKIVSEIISTI